MIYVSAPGCSGYALAAQAYLEAFLKSGQSLSWSPRTFGRCEYIHSPCGIPQVDACLGLALPTDRVLLHVVPSQLRLLNEEFRRYKRFVYTVWETSRLPDDWVAPLNEAHHVFVPCGWNKEVMERHGVRVPITVIPHLLCDEIAELQPPEPELPFCFYSIAPWSRRKGLDLLVEAFCRAFPSGESVRLVLKTGRQDRTRYSETWGLRHLSNAWHSTRRAVRTILRRHRRPPPVELLIDDLPRGAILNLHARSHCYVSLCRSEGWGLGAFEAAGMGIPVIITGYGGQLDFIDPSLAYLVDHRVITCDVGPWERFYRGHFWAEPDIDHAAALMREVHLDYATARRRAGLLRARILERFGWRRIMPDFCELVNR